MQLLREYIREKLLLGRILDNPNVSLIVLRNEKDKYPMRSITRSAKETGLWQMQTFDADGNPFWDNQYDSIKDAILPLMKKGFKIIEVQ